MTDEWGDPDPKRVWRAGVDVAGTVEAPPADYSFFPPPDQVVAPWDPPPPQPFLQRLLPHAATGAGTAAVLVLLGAPLALLWRWATPVVGITRTATGPQPVAPESNQVFAVDGWFVVVSLIAGAVVGALAWLALHDRGPGVPFGLAGGGLMAAFVASFVGERMVVDRYLYDFCRRADVDCLVYTGTLRLHATAAVVVLPVAMLGAYVAMTFFLDKD